MVKVGHFDAKSKQIAVVDNLFDASDVGNKAAYFLEKCKQTTAK
jgi:hypothetical protein